MGNAMNRDQDVCWLMRESAQFLDFWGQKFKITKIPYKFGDWHLFWIGLNGSFGPSIGGVPKIWSHI